MTRTWTAIPTSGLARPLPPCYEFGRRLERVTGSAEQAADLWPPRMLRGRLVRCSDAHARIRGATHKAYDVLAPSSYRRLLLFQSCAPPDPSQPGHTPRRSSGVAGCTLLSSFSVKTTRWPKRRHGGRAVQAAVPGCAATRGGASGRTASSGQVGLRPAMSCQWSRGDGTTGSMPSPVPQTSV
jgi:hypothetical protein